MSFHRWAAFLPNTHDSYIRAYMPNLLKFKINTLIHLQIATVVHPTPWRSFHPKIAIKRVTSSECMTNFPTHHQIPIVANSIASKKQIRRLL